MGLFKERRPSLPAMTMKTQDLEIKEEKVATVDREFVIKHEDAVGVDISVELEEDSRYQCLVRLQPCQDPTLYTIRLATNIQTFPLKTSCTSRSFSDWYFLDRVISQYFPQCKIKRLPPRHLLWIRNNQTKLNEIATFLLRSMSSREIIRSKVLQLFLQTQMSNNFIQENLEGKRNDAVSKVPNIEMNKPTEQEPKVIHLNLPKVNQNTYHGTGDSYKSVKNLFIDNRKKSFAYISENFNNKKQDLKPTLY